MGHTPDAESKKLFARQAQVFAAYVAYTDHEIGRVIQAVDDMGKMDNTLIIYIEGDNGTKRRRFDPGHPCPTMAAIQAPVNVPVPVQLEVLRRMGIRCDPHPAHVGGMVLGIRQRHSNGQNRLPRISVVPVRACASPGQTESRTRVASVPQFHHMIDVVPTVLEARRNSSLPRW